MRRQSRRWSRRHVVGGTIAIAFALFLGGCAEDAGPASPQAGPSLPVASPAPSSRTASSAAGGTWTLARSKPATLEIPAIGVRTGSIIELGLQPDGSLEVPDDAVTAGWFDQSPTPGELGPSIIAGHVDYDHVPGVFHRLHELPEGAKVVVHRADATSAVFTVYKIERYPKSRFPTAEVYGNTDTPELRLITCGGAFDSSSGNYVDNVVAYAELAGVRTG